MCHYSYRMSKAALNMGSRILAGEWAGRFPGAGVITVHPGLMNTPCSNLFFRRWIPPCCRIPPRSPSACWI